LRMANEDKTVFDPGATVPESISTVPDGGTTLLDDGAPISGSIAPASRVIRKGDTLLDIYRVEINAIESGGMGQVWRVHHTGWDVDLAMKRPRAEHFASEADKEVFTRECDAWINLGLHPNIVSCYYVRRIDDIPTIFSEWMDGGSLADAINGGGLYRANDDTARRERILDIAIQFARGLHYAHEMGLIHQDVKPDNVLLTNGGEAKVADFGISKARAVLTVLDGKETAAAGRTILSPSGGFTPAYCSIEQMDGKELTRRTDIYSWAVSVMEMYTGSRLWANGVVAGLSCRVYFEQTRIPMPEALKELLAKCMDAEPGNRPHDFAEIEARLHEIYKAETGTDYPRPAPKAAVDTADSLNNRALSMLDLGKLDEAEAILGDALAKDATAPDVVFNHAQLAWLRGRTDDSAALRALNSIAIERERNACLARLRTVIGPTDARESDRSIDRDKIARVIYDQKNERLLYCASRAAVNNKHRYALNVLGRGGDRRFELYDQHEPHRLTLSVDHKWVCLPYDDRIALCDVENGEYREIARVRTASAIAAFNGDGVYLGKEDGVYHYEISTARTSLISYSPTVCRNITQSGDGKLLAWRIEQNKQWSVRVFDMDSRTFLFSRERTGEPYEIEFSDDNDYLFVGDNDGFFSVYSIPTGDTLLHMNSGQRFISICAVPGGRYVLTGHSGGFRLWDIEHRICRRTYTINGDKTVYPYPTRGEDGVLRIGTVTRDGVYSEYDLPDQEVRPVWEICVVTSAVVQLSRDELFRNAISDAEAAFGRGEYIAALSGLKEARAISGYATDERCLSLYEKLAPHFRLCGQPQLVSLRRLPRADEVSLSHNGSYIMDEETHEVYERLSGECLLAKDKMLNYKHTALIYGDRLACIYKTGEKEELTADIFQLPGGERVFAGCLCTGSGANDINPSILAWPDCELFTVRFPGFSFTRNVTVDSVSCTPMRPFIVQWEFKSEADQLTGSGLIAGMHDIRHISNGKRTVKYTPVPGMDKKVSKLARYQVTADMKTGLVGAIKEHHSFYSIKPELQKELDSYDGCLFLYSAKTGKFIKMVKLSAANIHVHHGGYFTCEGDDGVLLYRIADFLDTDEPKPVFIPVRNRMSTVSFSADMLYMAIAVPRNAPADAGDTEVFLLDWELQ
jgi:serine/threonine protein kinase